MGTQYRGRDPGRIGAKGRNALVVGLLVGALGFAGVTAPFLRLEEQSGLDWLFALRGPIDPPGKVAVVGMSDDTALRVQGRCAEAGSDAPELCRSPEWRACMIIATEVLGDWPRCMHAHLVESLARAGAALIVLDVAFTNAVRKRRDLLLKKLLEKGGPVKLKLLDEAIARTGRVIQVEHWEIERLGDHELHRKVTADSAISASALATAPFPLPKTGGPLHRFWAFKVSMRDAPTLPVVVLQAHALPHMGDLVNLLEQAGLPEPEKLRLHLGTVGEPGRILGLISELRRQLRTHPEVARAAMARLDSLPQAASGYRDAFVSLLQLYSDAHSDFINFYGPPGTLPTFAADEAFWALGRENGEGSRVFRDKVIFVGASAPDRTGQVDGYHTVFTSDLGVDLSGVEIAATVFANLVTDNPVRSPGRSGSAALLVLFGVLVGVLAAVFEGWRGPVTVLAVGTGYFLLSHGVFSARHLHLPLFVPLVIQVPAAIVTGLFLHYLLQRRQRESLIRVMGFFMPAGATERLAQGEEPGAGSEQVQGTIVATDAVDFTSLAEGLSPPALQEVMNRYFEALGEAGRRRGGRVTDIKADSMMCVWPSQGDGEDNRRQACLAALEMRTESRTPMKEKPDLVLESRVGLHYGQVGLASVGGAGHFEYSLIGDDVNTASRIESANKRLGTHVMASRPVVEGLDDIFVRPLGTFLLRGKTNPLELFEVIGPLEKASPEDLRFRDRFAEGLALFRESRWTDAAEVFAAAVASRPGDGPSRFFLARCRERQSSPWRASPIVKFSEK